MRRLSVVFIVLLAGSGALHAAELGTEAMTVEFDRSELDLRNDRHQLHGNVRIQQGAMSIVADEASASALQTDDSRWRFERSVHVQTAEADLKSNVATAEFSNGQLRQAVAFGTPAVFEQRTALDKRARGRAGEIEYDFAKGIITLTNDVWFTYGDNEFRGNVVVYNVREERVVVNPDGKSSGRVNITIRPRPGASPQPPANQTPSNQPPSNQPGAPPPSSESGA